jgi:2'-5' RNA ligase
LVDKSSGKLDTARVAPVESALIVAIPEAEDVVGQFRGDLDVSAGWGVPAHVTVLYPFLAPDRIDERVMVTLADAVASVPVFHFTMRRLAWFDDRVLWLAPEPDGPFRALTDAVHRRFPDHPPYGGVHADPVPHLTVGHDAPSDVLRAAAEAIAAHLPIVGQVAAAQLMQGSAMVDSWRVIAEFPLGNEPAV